MKKYYVEFGRNFKEFDTYEEAELYCGENGIYAADAILPCEMTEEEENYTEDLKVAQEKAKACNIVSNDNWAEFVVGAGLPYQPKSIEAMNTDELDTVCVYLEDMIATLAEYKQAIGNLSDSKRKLEEMGA